MELSERSDQAARETGDGEAGAAPLQHLMPVAETGPGTEQLAQAAPAAVQLAQAGGARIGEVTELAGSATVARGGGAPQPLSLGDPVFLDDLLQTADGSELSVTFIDGTLFSLSGEGRMEVDRLIYDPDGSDNQLLLSLLQGTFGFVSGQINKSAGPGIAIDTPVGTIGLRGTAGVGDYDLARLLITLLQGAIGFSNNVANALLSSTFDTLNVSSANQADLDVAPMSPAEQAVYNALLPKILERVGPEAGEEETGNGQQSDSRASQFLFDPQDLGDQGEGGEGTGERGGDPSLEQLAAALAQDILNEIAQNQDPNLIFLTLTPGTPSGEGTENNTISVDNPEPLSPIVWEFLGDATVETEDFGSGPTEALEQALITTGPGSVPVAALENFLGLALGAIDSLGNEQEATEGSAIKAASPIFLEMGDILTFDFNFLTDEIQADDDVNDFAFVTINPLFELADVFGESAELFETSEGTRFADEIGFQTFEFIAPATGEYELGIGVVDVSDFVVDSGLLVDNVTITPGAEPSIEA